MSNVTEKEKSLWQKMADLTFSKCKEHCHILGSCCESDYCEEARRYAKEEHGVDLVKELGQFPFIKDGKCLVPPHFRPICTVHQCKISCGGYDPKDPKWTRKYFALREKLDEILSRHIGVGCERHSDLRNGALDFGLNETEKDKENG